VVKILVFERVGGLFWAQISGEGGRPPTTLGVRRLETRGVVCVILCLAVLIQYRRVTQTETMMANTRASLAPRG